MTDTSSVVLTPAEESTLNEWVIKKIHPAFREGGAFQGQLHHTFEHFKIKRKQDPKLTVEEYIASFPPPENNNIF